MVEEYRTIEAFPNYSVSNLGNVKNNITGKILKPGNGGSRTEEPGYPKVNLYNSSEHKFCYIHHLVGEAFIGNPKNLPYINHIDEDKTNNKVDNLEYVTITQNNRHNNVHLKNGKKRSDTYRKKHSKPIIQYTKTGEFVKYWDSYLDAKIADEKFVPCKRVADGRQKSSNGFVWKWA